MPGAGAVVVDHTLIVGDTYGTLHAYDVSDTRVNPPQILDLHAQEREAPSSPRPAVWKGRIYVARGTATSTASAT